MASFGFDLNAYMRANRFQKSTYDCGPFTRHIVCADGYTLSVQASSFHYSTPRRNDADAYTHVEVGVMNGATPDELLEPTGDDWVFGYVPVEVVEAIVWKHGGLKEGHDVQPGGVEPVSTGDEANNAEEKHDP